MNFEQEDTDRKILGICRINSQRETSSSPHMSNEQTEQRNGFLFQN